MIGGIGGLFIFAFIADFLDQNGLLQPIIDYFNTFGAFVALHKTVIVAGIGGIVAVRLLFKLPHTMGWIAGRLARAMREGFEKGLRG